MVDEAEVLLYRQHGANVMGHRKQGCGLAAAGAIAERDLRGWIAQFAGLAAVEKRLTPEARRIVSTLAQTQGRWARLRAFGGFGHRAAKPEGTACLYLSVLLGLARRQDSSCVIA